MGNVIRRLCADGFERYGSHDPPPTYNSTPADHDTALGPHGVTFETVGFTALARDLFQFDLSGQVPDGLSNYVQSSRNAQSNWYKKILVAWKEAQPPPSTAEEASQLVIQALQGHRKVDVQGFLSFYGVPPRIVTDVGRPEPTVVSAPTALNSQAAIAIGPWPKGVQYELQTLPVDVKGVTDGDTIVVYVDSHKDATAQVPQFVIEAAEKIRVARARQDSKTLGSLQKQILQAGYKVLESEDQSSQTLVRKYRVRLRGVDAPESAMPYGPEAKEFLRSLVEGQPLRLLVYTTDQYGRIVADVYCHWGFIQELLLKSGFSWHYIAYDRRPEFTEWEKEAREARKGLWASRNPQKPWEYRKDKRMGG